MGLFAPHHLPVASPPPIVATATQIDLGRTAAAVELCREFAARHRTATFDITWWSLCNIPVNMLCLLDSPQGWSTLAGYIAHDLGLAATAYRPGVH